MLRVENLFAGYYPEVNIIEDISLFAEKSKITCIIGPNGSGKSTLLKTIYGFLKPKKGKILFKEKDITGLSPFVLARMGISYIPQERCIFPDHTVYENLKLATWIFRKDKKRVKDSIELVYDIFPILKTKKNDKASTLSGGQQRMLELSRTLISGADFILVDEPTCGLAPKVCVEVYDAMEKLKKRGTTMLLVDQNIRLATNISDYVYVISSGRVKAEGAKKKFEPKLKSLIKSWI